jgi:hypothetical protein
VEEMSIGEFARRSSLSAKALRLNDGLDLLSPRLKGREGAMFSIYWAQGSADSDGPVEWCKPVPDAEAEGLVAQFPELTLRVEPAHREAYVDLGTYGQGGPAQWQLADEALRTWADEQGIDPKKLSLTPGGPWRADHLPGVECGERPRV